MAEADKNAGPVFVKEWREFRDMTQAELAALVGTNQNMIGYLESGERALTTKWARRLAGALRTSPESLIGVPPSVGANIIELWLDASEHERVQLISIAKTLIAKKAG